MNRGVHEADAAHGREAVLPDRSPHEFAVLADVLVGKGVRTPPGLAEAQRRPEARRRRAAIPPPPDAVREQPGVVRGHVPGVAEPLHLVGHAAWRRPVVVLPRANDAAPRYGAAVIPAPLLGT